MKNNAITKGNAKIIITILLAAVLAVAAAFAVGCGVRGNENEYTVAFYDGDTVLKSVTGKAGDPLEAPVPEQKQGLVFGGWFETKEFTGEAATVPTAIPEKNVTYYAKYDVKPAAERHKIIYEFNLGSVSHGGEITPSEGETGEEVELKDGREFYVGGYRFLGWTKERAYVYDADKPFAPYLAGEKMQIESGDVTLYAQWAVVYYSADDDNTDTVCVFEPLVDRGLGGAIYVSKGKDDKKGFAASAENTNSGYNEFTFYYDDGEVYGRLYDDNTYAVGGAEAGEYLYYDYASDETLGAYLALDGFGYAVYLEQLGDQTSVRASGLYMYDEEYGDYTFAYLDENNEQAISYFALDIGTPEDTMFDGYFSFQGGESGTYMLYINGELYDYALALNGYGYAALYAYDADADITEVVSRGKYVGTDNYIDYVGEWRYEPTSGESVTFMLSTLNYGGDNVPIYIEYSAEYAGEFTAANGNGTLYLDGYGNAEYKISDMTYFGECVVGNNGTLLTFAAHTENNGSYIDAGTMYFNLDFAAHTFNVNTDGFAIDGDELTDYVGTARVVEIPDTVKTVSADAFNNPEVSLISVTIPASVTAIGARAFQNNYTLRRAVFLSETPIDIDFSDAVNPFRWPAGDFVIVVPEGSQEAYKAAWSDCPFAIKGSVEVTRLPEFEIENGVLVRYNKQPDSAALLDIKIPDGVTEIADNVFRGADYLRSVDLNNVTTVGVAAFYLCENLVSVKFTNVATIGDGAFSDCIKLSTSGEDGVLALPAAVTVGDGAFAGCIALRRVVMGAGLERIGATAFMECQIYENEPPLFVVLTGDAVPEMGDHISAGNIAFRIEVANVAMAVKCFEASGWNSYCRHLYIPSGDEKGRYVSGADVLEIDGRAVYQSSELWLYEIRDNAITFYAYDSELGTYSTFAGEIADGVITVKIYGTGSTRTFRKSAGNVTYTTADGKYTLVCDPAAFDPANYEQGSGYADVTFNGQSLKMLVAGYNTKTVIGYVGEDGLKYNVAVRFIEEEMSVTLRREERIENIAAPDGSVMNIHYSGTLVYIYGEFKIKVGTNDDGTDKFLSFTELSSVIATVQDNTFTFTFRFLNTAYTITATVSEDGTTFTYTYTTK